MYKSLQNYAPSSSNMGIGDEYTVEAVDEEELAGAQHSGYRDVVAEGRRSAVKELGSMGEYLEGCLDDARPARNAPQRVADMLEHYGSVYDAALDRDVHEMFTEDPLHDRTYAFHDEAVFEAVDRFVRKATVFPSRVHRLPLPDSEAGANAAHLLQRYFEEYTAKEEGRLYTFEWTDLGSVLDDREPGQDTIRSPLNQDPFVLLSLDESVWDALNERHDGTYTLRNDQHLDPESAFYRDRLLDHYDGDLNAVLANHIEVVPVEADRGASCLLDTVDLAPRKAYDATELVGGPDWENVTRYGERDPRVFGYDGGFQHANQGILQVENLSDTATEGLYDLQMAMDTGRTKPPHAPSMDIDQVIITHGPTHPFDVLVDERHHGHR